jgi:ABC-type transporter Mla subunit MlaD
VSARLEARIGLLVLAGIAAAVAMVLLSDRFDFEPRYRLAVYLDDAEGLRPDSPVTFAGLPVGEVLAVEQVADPRGRVRAEVAVRRSRRLPGDTVVRLASNGFFGDSFLALNGGAARDRPPLADDGSAVLVARPGFLAETGDKAQRLIDGLNATLDDGTRANLQRLIANGADLAGEGAGLLRELRATQARLAAVVERADAVLARGASVAARAEDALAAVERLAGRIEAEVPALSVAASSALAALATAARSAGAAADGFAAGAPALGDALAATAVLARQASTVAARLAAGEGFLGQLLVSPALARDLQGVAVDLAALAKRLADKPSRLVFDAAPAEAAADRADRDARKQRRALELWLGAGATAAPAP